MEIGRNVKKYRELRDFTLPDLACTAHSLSDYRGQKVLLATWASW